MLKILPSQAKLAVNSSLLTSNTLVLAPLLYVTALVRALPSSQVRSYAQKTAVRIAEQWIGNNNQFWDATQNTQYELEGLDVLNQLDIHSSYVVIANHQSWTDILLLQKLFNRRIPVLRFFLKQELIWVPIMGLCWWVLDFPFMKRYTKEQLAKNPALKGKDKETTIARMQQLKNIPVSIMNFVEGTRFTAQKHQAQQSPFAHLLKPRAAGLSYALSVMPDKLTRLIDVTIAYPDGQQDFKSFLSGVLPRVKVHVTLRDIPEALRYGDYENDAAFRSTFQNWLNGIWQEKEQRITNMLASPSSTS